MTSEKENKLFNIYDQIAFGSAKESDLRRDNANINTDAPMGQMLKVGAEGMKAFIDDRVLSEEALEADKAGFIHIHDKDFSLFTFNCCQLDLKKLFSGGFSTGHGFLREPNSLRTAASLACIAIQSNQNEMFGGQSINALDYALAPYVDKSFKKALKKQTRAALLFYMADDLRPDDLDLSLYHYYHSKEGWTAERQDMAQAMADYLKSKGAKLPENYLDSATYVVGLACQDVEEEAKQAMEAMIHNFNTLHSRAGRMCA